MHICCFLFKKDEKACFVIGCVIVMYRVLFLVANKGSFTSYKGDPFTCNIRPISENYVKARIGILGAILTQIRVYFVKSNTQGAKTFLKFGSFDQI